MVMGGRVNEANDLATLKAAIANVSFGLRTEPTSRSVDPWSLKRPLAIETPKINEFRLKNSE